MVVEAGNRLHCRDVGVVGKAELIPDKEGVDEEVAEREESGRVAETVAVEVWMAAEELPYPPCVEADPLTWSELLLCKKPISLLFAYISDRDLSDFSSFNLLLVARVGPSAFFGDERDPQ